MIMAGENHLGDRRRGAADCAAHHNYTQLLFFGKEIAEGRNGQAGTFS